MGVCITYWIWPVSLFVLVSVGTDLPAGHPVKLLVGFSNKGSQDFIVESMDAAFRYPQDYSFYIQNVCVNDVVDFRY